MSMTTAETAKEVRKALKSAFPGIKFSVRSSVYSGGSSIDVSWTDGPTRKAVQAVTQTFEGAYLGECGGDTIKMYHQNEYGADYVTPRRNISVAFLTLVAGKFCARYHEVMPEIVECGGDAFIKTHCVDYWAPENQIMRLAEETDAANVEQMFAEEEQAEAQEAEVQEDIIACAFCEQVVSSDEVQIINSFIVCSQCISVEIAQLATQDIELPADEPEAGMLFLEMIEPEEIPTIDLSDEGEAVSAPVLSPSIDQQFAAHDADPRSDAHASTIYRFDPVSRIHWLEFDGKPEQEVITLLKKEGWHWSGYRKQWHTNRRWTQVPAGIDYFNAGECDYSAERAERLEARAEKASERGQSHYKRAHQIMDMIPFGQPILVGHHSEKRARKDRDRIDTGMHNWIQESDKARKLESKAEASTRHREFLEQPGVIHRRIQRLEADLRAFERHQDRWEGNMEEYERRVKLLKQDIETNKEQLEAAGGIQSDHVEVEAGDIILIGGFVGKVIGKPRVDGKTYKILITEGGAKGMELTEDRSRLQKVLQKGSEVHS